MASGGVRTHGFTISAYGRCTKREDYLIEKPANFLVSGRIYGPDTGWVLLDDSALQTFCARGGDLQHRGKISYDHLCAAKGAWAFDAQDTTSVCCVFFLHYRVPSKFQELTGEADTGSGASIFRVKRSALLEQYQAINTALAGQGKAHVWKRDTAQWGELAIDFCMSKA
jgi:hypothetical protein